MASDSDFKPLFQPSPFVEVSTPDGTRRRFAAGTKAGFAIERINHRLVEPSKKYMFIESIKEGEEAVEFGPDAELVSYGEGWRLQAAQDDELSKSRPSMVNKDEDKHISESVVKDEPKDISQPIQKVFDPADFYPGGKLPKGSPPANASVYIWNVSWAFGCMFLLAGLWVYLLESQFFTG